MKLFLLLIFVANSSGIFITCNFNTDNYWYLIGRVYTCQVISVNFYDNSTTHITGYNGAHLGGNSGAKVGMVEFPSSKCPQFKLKTVPKGFSNFFPNIMAFYIDRCSITSLNGDELDEYQTVQISQKHVGEGLLDNLQNLQEAHFQSNICINKGASNLSQIPALIEALRQNCTDIEQETTTQLTTKTISTSTSTNQPPRCAIDDFEDFFCGLDEEIENLKSHIEEMRRELENQAEAFSQLEQMVIYLSTRP